ncbi:MAG: L,D-transpeptidase family protein [Pseudomonadota bacterium]
MRDRREDLIVGRWGARFLGRRFPCAIGVGGMTSAKREGDGATPVGVHRLVDVMHRADRVPRPISRLPVRAIGGADIWSDDPRDPDYNHGLRARAHPFSHERMRRGDGLYDIVVTTDWNWPKAAPGRGSAIFVHCWKRPRKPTAGCIAFRRSDLLWIITRWERRSRLVVYE